MGATLDRAAMLFAFLLVDAVLRMWLSDCSLGSLAALPDQETLPEKQQWTPAGATGTGEGLESAGSPALLPLSEDPVLDAALRGAADDSEYSKNSDSEPEEGGARAFANVCSSEAEAEAEAEAGRSGRRCASLKAALRRFAATNPEADGMLKANASALVDRGVFVYHQHIRKSGGTTLNNYLDVVETSEQAVFGFVHSERRQFPVACLDHRNAAHTIFATVLREPISRLESDFNYLGFPRKAGLMAGADVLTDDEVLPVVQAWVGKPGRRGESHRMRTYKVGTFIPNHMTRYFSGKCACLDLEEATVALAHSPGKGSNFVFHHINGCFGRDLQPGDLDMAKRALERFDLLFTLDMLHNSTLVTAMFERALAKKTGNRFGKAVRFVVPKKTHGNKKQVKRVRFSNHPPVMELLRNRSDLDRELYEHALQRSVAIRAELGLPA